MDPSDAGREQLVSATWNGCCAPETPPSPTCEAWPCRACRNIRRAFAAVFPDDEDFGDLLDRLLEDGRRLELLDDADLRRLGTMPSR